jgi:AraC-like DNA-binding protein
LTLDRVVREIPSAQVIITTTLPRGGLQVIHERGADPAWVRAYSREHHLLDATSWESLRREAPQRLSTLRADRSGGVAHVTTRFASAAMAPAGIAHCLSCPLASPLLEGYPGTIQLHRGADEPDFSSEEVGELEEIVADFATAIDALRRERQGEGSGAGHPLVHELSSRQLALTSDGRFLFPDDSPPGLDEVLRQNLVEAAAQRLAGARDQFGGNGRAPAGAGTRGALASIPQTKACPLPVPDETGDQWIFRLVMYECFPALTRSEDDPVAVISLPPECDAWAQLRASDIQADAELARLIPALHYMHANFSTGINLSEVAQSVNLSPFHFHRRFSELLGTTPKQFLFDCQIGQAKRLLSEGEKSLLAIASDTGFAHQSHFTSRFRQATGFTPTKWRRMAASKTRNTT